MTRWAQDYVLNNSIHLAFPISTAVNFLETSTWVLDFCLVCVDPIHIERLLFTHWDSECDDFAAIVGASSVIVAMLQMAYDEGTKLTCDGIILWCTVTCLIGLQRRLMRIILLHFLRWVCPNFCLWDAWYIKSRSNCWWGSFLMYSFKMILSNLEKYLGFLLALFCIQVSSMLYPWEWRVRGISS